MKYLKILVIALILLLCISCTSYKEYNKDNSTKFLDEFYDQINNVKEKYVAFDLRDKTSYETLHIRQCQNFDYQSSSLDKFITYLTDNYNKQTKIYLISDEMIEIEKIQEKYDFVHILVCDFASYNEYATSLFTMDKGEYDCGC